MGFESSVWGSESVFVIWPSMRLQLWSCGGYSCAKVAARRHNPECLLACSSGCSAVPDS